MAHLDSQLQFSDSQALTATADSTNVIDLGADHNIFEGEPMIVVINVEVAADTADGDETYAFELETDDNDSFSSATSLLSRTIDKASLTAGSQHTLAIQTEAPVERYLQLVYTLGGTTPSVTVSAYLAPQSMIDKRTEYPIGYTIS